MRVIRDASLTPAQSHFQKEPIGMNTVSPLRINLRRFARSIAERFEAVAETREGRETLMLEPLFGPAAVARGARPEEPR
jgi:hypothetical protein